VNQTDQIRTALLAGRELTPLDALEEFGCFRLAARIKDLRAEGLDIETVSETRNGKKFARYRVAQSVSPGVELAS
jgi:biotin operon repressor